MVIGFDGSSSATHTVRTAVSLFAPAPVLVVAVWEAGLGFELLESPVSIALAPIDVTAALDIDRSVFETAQRLAETGAEVARKAGVKATGLAVADEGTVADTLVRLVRERHARALVVGTHGRRGLRHRAIGSTARSLVESAPCPTLVIRYQDADEPSEDASPKE